MKSGDSDPRGPSMLAGFGILAIAVMAAFVFLVPAVPCPNCSPHRYRSSCHGTESNKVTLYRRLFPARVEDADLRWDSRR